MRARLSKSLQIDSFRIICDEDTVRHIERVVGWSGGNIAIRECTTNGVILQIVK